ncbi:DUF6093 family protein [Microbacterium sp. M4A5_1d]
MRSPSQRATARYRAEQGFTETVIVGTYRDGVDAATANATRELVTKHYEGPAQLVYRTLNVSDRNTASRPIAEQAPILKLPSGTVVPRGAEVDVTASAADASLVGRRMKIAGRPQSGQTTSARYPLQELT